MVRFGILGFGLHAAKRLMPGFRRARNARVTALSRRDGERAGASAREYGIAHAFTSAEELCRSPEVDAVFVATPNNCHLRDVLVALEHGKPVLVEKPMAMNAAEARRMLETARQKRLLLGVAQIFRFANSVRRLRELMAGGEIGRVVLTRCEFSYWGASAPRTWICDAAIAGGGPIADVGVHCIDALRFILQDEVRAICARGFADQQSGSVEAAAAVTLEFRQSGLAVVLVSTRAQYRTPMELVGQGGVIRVDDAFSVDKPVTIEVRHGEQIVTEETSNQLAYAQQVDAFAAAVEDGAPFPAPAEEGWRNQVVLDAAYRSLKTGRTELVTEF